MKTPRVPVAQEGYPFILFSGLTALVFGLLEFEIIAVSCLVLTGFITWFFRDPDRIIPDDDVLMSPADGKVIISEEVEDLRFGDGKVYKVSIFMNVFNVHVNRFPLGGTVNKVVLQPGKFYSADSLRGALQNEYCAMTVTTDNDLTYGVVQVAGLIARRIVCWAEKGDCLVTGQRYGLIRFGSRVDLYLPLEMQLRITKGDKVRAGETVIAALPDPVT